ncbi:MULTISPECIES: hypothetical protein [Enterococcus]|uniref:Uncharacterized protein n=1 Tax=Enterococcus malodoratus ATCC 43197 TaxID=1158601 RepID=R2P2C6_9ENTE|nr:MULTISPECIES: hypothetical protein [Enterococcus]BBM17058.1 hypothetical protein G15_0699 [Enterococcus avium]EOH77383.1 hypothetical protein UAI_02020 [Enterococcus malodoratus ATCC 43197]EOT64203.1 hypothetical protein I585_03400 [Enterococcus malodoratus ATCC 43197]OJG64399.1 hypothetical protein RV07_GL004372 [Enterococcus malodoratus]SES94449.1 hypothetical protein SAMN04487821_104100 [Enterococcus malodoratus]
MKIAIILSTILIALVNFYLFYVYFKEKKIEDKLEKLAVMFGANMSVLFVDSLILFFGALVEEGLFMMTIFSVF